MSRISPEKEIAYISKVIEKNIYYYDRVLKDKGFLSENILSQLRNFVEDVAILINNKKNNLNLDSSYVNVEQSMDYVKTKKEYKYLYEFHRYLQGTASHYTPNEDGAERLVSYYYRYLCLIKKTLKDEYDIDIINNIDLFPIYDDKSMKENYDIICEKIESINIGNKKAVEGKFYVEKCNTIFSKGNIYYELTLSKATDYNNKFERLTFYSKVYIPDNYSVNIYSVDDKVELNVGVVNIKVITNYKIAIRVCELQNLFKIFGISKNLDDKYKEYRNLMGFLTENECTIRDVLCSEDKEYDNYIELIKNGADNHYISDMLEKIRYIIINKKPAHNILRYLTTKMVNTVIRLQLSDKQHRYLSNLFIHKKCGMFEAMPYAMSLHKHNPRFCDLVNAIDIEGRDDELLYSFIRNNTEKYDQLYTPLDEIGYFEDIPELVSLFNQKMLSRISDSNSILMIENGFLYIKEYEENSIKIIKELVKYAYDINFDLNEIVKLYLDAEGVEDISEDKIAILNNIFLNGSLALIYGPAGTGKTKMIELLSGAFNNYDKCVLSNTNTSVTNLVSRLKEIDNLRITTISNYIKNYSNGCDVLIIDECSMISNSDMIKVLKKFKYKAIILVGDIYQIESIEYGNWFQVCSRYFNNDVSYELEMIHRTSDDDLLSLWDCVRSNDERAISIMSNKEYTEDLSKEIFSRTENEEIILCLNYDGMYGINNINRVMQNSNSNPEYVFGVDVFKVGDPVLFNDCPRFSGFVHNNLKGVIRNIEKDEEDMIFSIEVDSDSIDEFYKPTDIQLITSDKVDKVILRFKVNKYKDRDDDENKFDHIIPFNLSYAISIHKAQGLEYDSVKVVITSNIEDRITKNIFYTAITRAKKKLKVYWNSDSQIKIFDGFKKRESKRDLAILNQKIKNS